MSSSKEFPQLNSSYYLPNPDPYPEPLLYEIIINSY